MANYDTMNKQFLRSYSSNMLVTWIWVFIIIEVIDDSIENQYF